jgi:diaminopimelate decarboxylase
LNDSATDCATVTLADLKAALSGAGILVVDSLAELQQLLTSALASEPADDNPWPDVWLRLRPGQAVDTHAHRQTGQADSKFGMEPNEIREAVGRAREAGLSVTGLHFHQGSHFRDPAPLALALDLALDLIAWLRAEAGWLPRFLCPGGGWAVAYHQDELPHPPIRDYVDFIVRYLVDGCRRRCLPLPHLQLEPGRSLVARAGVALYRVGAVKTTAGRHWLLLDGGMADNIRPALYGARYSALPVWQPRRPGSGPAWLAGPYCESGDVLIQGLSLPAVEPGELVAVPMSGAYQLSMSSNYNGACRPGVVWLRHDGAHLVQEREQPGDLYRRDRPLPPL